MFCFGLLFHFFLVFGRSTSVDLVDLSAIFYVNIHSVCSQKYFVIIWCYGVVIYFHCSILFVKILMIKGQKKRKTLIGLILSTLILRFFRKFLLLPLMLFSLSSLKTDQNFSLVVFFFSSGFTNASQRQVTDRSSSALNTHC